MVKCLLSMCKALASNLDSDIKKKKKKEEEEEEKLGRKKRERLEEQ